MTMKNIWSGVIPPVPTAIDETGQFAPQAMAALIDHLVASAVNGLLFLGTTGEFSAMSVSQRKQVAEFCIRHTNQRKPVMIGVAAHSIAETIELAQHAERTGADAVIVVNPSYVKYSDEGLYHYYRSVAESIGIPVFLYNFPKLTSQPLSVALVGRLANDVDNIIGIKDTVDDIVSTRRYITKVKSKHPNFRVFSGFDEHLANNLLMGGDGGIPSSSNFAPSLTCGVFQAFQQGDWNEFTKQHRRIAILSEMYDIQAPFFPVVKAAINLVGIPFVQGTLPPCDLIAEHSVIQLRELLKSIKIIE
ncbi:dihydrodipicolinate synthase family protein [Vibrio rhizosphaerae]|uniref:Dihydrodipicolinate synthase family protein n=1 Tax=Vibrio rhizosphaerae TaxID=398736 RepID=A0ABU4IVU5_9VIBR|nr:dihydrodipicolinate synthase family protein [Vibrio rhizosphaerae]MDW6093540.1 dihydrodipicolinate synthase family protein [Vibrio rhizosphaerae]